MKPFDLPRKLLFVCRNDGSGYNLMMEHNGSQTKTYQLSLARGETAMRAAIQAIADSLSDSPPSEKKTPRP